VGQDHLYGGSENDNLYGDNRYFDEELNRYVLVDDKESDRLEGGAGDDLYYAGAGDIKVWVSYSSYSSVMRRQQDL
jgi:Ca2+-binding RTX toxin-like protein